jgi:hypothetical protein
MKTEYVSFESLVGKTLRSVEGAKKHSRVITFETTTGEKFEMDHEQDCCESVLVEDVCGEVEDLIGSPIVQAEVSTNRNDNPSGVPTLEYQDSFTWTFYRIATAKGQVVLRWYGESNGYYSETVSFKRLID